MLVRGRNVDTIITILCIFEADFGRGDNRHVHRCLARVIVYWCIFLDLLQNSIGRAGSEGFAILRRYHTVRVTGCS